MSEIYGAGFSETRPFLLSFFWTLTRLVLPKFFTFIQYSIILLLFFFFLFILQYPI